MTASTSDVLVRAADLISEYGFAQGAFARDEQGRAVSCMSADAVSFCPLGAMWRAQKELCAPQTAYHQAVKTLTEQVRKERHPITRKRFRYVAEWSDVQRTPRAITALIQAAAEEANEASARMVLA